MKYRFPFGAVIVATLALSASDAGDSLKSGIPVGGRASAFHPLNLTGASKDKKNCLVWQYGGSSVAAIFARGTSDSLASLVKQIDSTKEINSFVIFLSDEENVKDVALKFAEKNGIKKTILAIDNVAGPKGYNLNKNAEVTVLLYTGGEVKANHAYRKADFNAKAVEAIVKDIPKILEK